MAQRNYTCLVGVGFAFMTIGFGLVLASLFTRSWLIYTSTGSYSVNSFVTAGYWLLGLCIENSCTGLDKAEQYQVACFALIISGSALSGIGFLCLFLYLCGSCCCRISKWMTVMPKINLLCAILGCLTTGAACALYLIGFYVIDGHSSFRYNNYSYTGSFFSSGWVPGYSFFFAAVAAVCMFISGVVAFGAKNATRVDVVAQHNPQTIVVSNVVNNSSSSYPPQQYNPYQPNQPQNPSYHNPGMTKNW